MSDGHVLKPRILVVDDEVAICTLIRYILEDGGYCVETATDGRALHVAAGTQPALVLLDLMMPGMDGYEIGLRLRAHPATAAIPIVIMSAGARVRQAAEQIGADGYLEKPFELTALLRTVAAHAH
jgi:two-component system phosphate regulon response regulator PhoB